MKFTAIFVLCLALTAYAGHLENIFEDLPDTEFTRTMLTTIELQLKSGESVDTLIETMEGVDDSLKSQLASAEKDHREKGDSCDDDKFELNKGLNQAGTDLDKYEKLAEFDGATLASRSEELVNKQTSLQGRRDMLEVLHTQREEERETFESTVAEYQSVFALIDDVRAVINAKLVAGGDLFLQTSMGTEIIALVENFHTTDHGITHKYHGFFKVMATVVSKAGEVHADQSIVQNLLDICDRIEENLDMAEALERDAERQRQADYEELSVKVDEQVRYIMNQMVDLNSEIFTLQERLASLSDKLADARESFDSFEARLADRTEECSIEQQVWENFYNNITTQLTVSGKIMYLVEDKRALLARYGL